MSSLSREQADAADYWAHAAVGEGNSHSSDGEELEGLSLTCPQFSGVGKAVARDRDLLLSWFRGSKLWLRCRFEARHMVWCMAWFTLFLIFRPEDDVRKKVRSEALRMWPGSVACSKSIRISMSLPAFAGYGPRWWSHLSHMANCSKAPLARFLATFGRKCFPANTSSCCSSGCPCQCLCLANSWFVGSR